MLEAKDANDVLQLAVEERQKPQPDLLILQHYCTLAPSVRECCIRLKIKVSEYVKLRAYKEGDAPVELPPWTPVPAASATPETPAQPDAAQPASAPSVVSPASPSPEVPSAAPAAGTTPDQPTPARPDEAPAVNSPSTPNAATPASTTASPEKSAAKPTRKKPKKPKTKKAKKGSTQLTKKALKEAKRKAKAKETAAKQRERKKTAEAKTKALNEGGKTVASIHKAIDGQTRRSTPMAIKAGGILNAKKLELPKINDARYYAGMKKILWGQWLKDHHIHERRAQRDMKLAKFFGGTTMQPWPSLTEAYIRAGCLKMGKEPEKTQLTDSELETKDAERERRRAEKKKAEIEYDSWRTYRDHRIDSLLPALQQKVTEMLTAFGVDPSRTPRATICAGREQDFEGVAKSVKSWASALVGDSIVACVLFTLPPTRTSPLADGGPIGDYSLSAEEDSDDE